jgi:hypothetical protein
VGDGVERYIGSDLQERVASGRDDALAVAHRVRPDPVARLDRRSGDSH